MPWDVNQEIVRFRDPVEIAWWNIIRMYDVGDVPIFIAYAENEASIVSDMTPVRGYRGVFVVPQDVYTEVRDMSPQEMRQFLRSYVLR